MDATARKLLTLPWEVVPAGAEPTAFMNRRILWTLTTKIGLSAAFRMRPSDAVMQSIALPTVLFMARNRLSTYVHENPWLTRLTKAEQAHLVKEFGLTSDMHSVLALALTPAVLEKYLSYSVALFAFSTKRVPMVVELPELVSFFSTYGYDDTDRYDSLLSCGMLVIKSPLGNVRGLRDVTGSFLPLLTHRMRTGRLTVYADLAFGEARHAIKDKGEEPTASALSAMLAGTVIGKTQICSFLHGDESALTILGGSK